MHCIGGERGGHHHSVIGSVLEFTRPCLVSVLFTGPSLLEIKFYRNFSLSIVPCTCHISDYEPSMVIQYNKRMLTNRRKEICINLHCNMTV